MIRGKIVVMQTSQKANLLTSMNSLKKRIDATLVAQSAPPKKQLA
ncbi:MAG: hypothetical protein NTZ24_14720 [Deltaproteobacteria bacterium]|nr:hypothetical protein [Deltaproteobacteria bacterium]